MNNKATISGTVKELITRETTNGKTELYVILEETNGKYTDTIAVKCWRDTVKAAAQLLRPGQLCEVAGRIRSRAWKDRYFTDFEAETIAVKGKAQHAEVSADLEPTDDELGF